MSAESDKIRDLFMSATERQPGADRVAYLDEVCAGNVPLRRRLNVLLDIHDKPDDLLDRVAAEHLLSGTGLLTPDLPRAQPPDVRVPLEFLKPSQRPDSLGRLDHYEVLEVLGRGGMGVVCRAFDEKLHRMVAIKFMAQHLAANGAARARFGREARAAAAVTHEAIIAIYAVEDNGAVLYMVMQCIVGKTLQQKLNLTGTLELREILRVGHQIADGLGAAHRLGLIHRDIKPANILLENGVERVKITDFGLARAADDASQTHRGYIAGTPLYMSPEQARGDAVDHRSDLFSLGSVLYALCTGHPPFRAENSMAILKRVCDDTPRPIRESNSQIPGWLEAIVTRLLAKEPKERFQTADEVATLLSQRLLQLNTLGSTTELQSELVPPTHLREPPQVAALSPRRSLRWIALVAVLICVALGWVFRDQFRPHAEASKNDSSAELNSTAWNPPPPPTAADLARLRSPLDQRNATDIPKRILSMIEVSIPDPIPKELVAVLSEPSPVVAVAVSPNGRWVACGGYDHVVRLWDLESWPKGADFPASKTLKAHSDTVWSVAFSPDSRLLASGSFDGTIILWDCATGRKVTDLVGYSRKHSLIAFSPDGHTIAAGSESGEIHRWDVATGQSKKPIPLHTRIVRAVAYSPNGELLASASHDGTIHLIDVATQRRLHVLRGSGFQTNVTFSPDSKTVMATCDVSGPGVPCLRIWDCASGVELQALSGHTFAVGGLACHPLGNPIATGAWDGGSLRFWNPATGASKLLSFGPSTAVVGLVSVAWSPEGRHLIACREKDLVYVFRINP